MWERADELGIESAGLHIALLECVRFGMNVLNGVGDSEP